MQDESVRSGIAGTTKKPWEAPKLSYIGDVEEVVQGGTGKLTTTPSDPGEAKKTPPTG
jgi:hypothetical protein